MICRTNCWLRLCSRCLIKTPAGAWISLSTCRQATNRSTVLFVSIFAAMQALQALQLNTTEEKLDWVFSIFDSDSGGTIEISEVEQIVSNIFDFADIKPDRRMIQACVMDVKRSVDRDNDGTITKEEFIENARQG